VDTQGAPELAGIHHVKLPVTDLARACEWYKTRLGYRVQIEFVEEGQRMGYVLEHPNGGPLLGLRLDPERARASAGFDYFAIGVPGRQTIEQLAARLTALGEPHAATHTHWFRLADGKIIEHWANRDDLATAQQAGWVPPSPRYLVRMALAKRRARATTNPG
jgi:catechol 2,3-dioxygenase-like lactoylglutathione lyase family enzyme